MRLVFTANGWTDYTHWMDTDRAVLKRLTKLIDATLRDPTSGIGKPELLRENLVGCWSRRITDEHRLVYLVSGDDLVILGARHHY